MLSAFLGAVAGCFYCDFCLQINFQHQAPHNIAIHTKINNLYTIKILKCIENK